MSDQALDEEMVSVGLLPDSEQASYLLDGILDVLPVPCHLAVLQLDLASCHLLLPTADGSQMALTERLQKVWTGHFLKALPDCLMKSRMVLRQAACCRKESTMVLSDSKMKVLSPAVCSAKTMMVLTGHWQKILSEKMTVWLLPAYFQNLKMVLIVLKSCSVMMFCSETTVGSARQPEKLQMPILAALLQKEF